MKRIAPFLLATALPLLLIAQPQKTSRKLALVIAIGTYEKSTGWKTISSLNDMPYIKAALMAQGFSENNIDTLKNEQATKDGIIQSLDNLINKANTGDIVVFHFSGHGQQIYDDASRKDENDGFDEALVPWNAGMRYNPVTNNGKYHLRDEELGDKLKLLRKKIGNTGSLLVLLDACHSGTGTRGQDIAITRGTDTKLQPDNYNPGIAANSNSYDGVFDDKELLSNMVVISAASADQLNYETKDLNQQGVGSLSYAFSRALTSLTGPVDYKILFEKIKADIQSWKPFQNPQIEGNTTQQVLGGQYIKTGDWVTIEKWLNEKTILVPKGSIHAVSKGAGFKVYPVEVIDYANTSPVATGVIEQTGIARSTGVLSVPVSNQSSPYKVVFDSKSFGDMLVSVKLLLQDGPTTKTLLEQFKQYDYIRVDNTQADIAIEAFKDPQQRQQQLQVVADDGKVLWQKDWPANSSNALSDADSDAIRKVLKQFSRARFLRTIATAANDKSFELVQVSIVPGKVKSTGNSDELAIRQELADFTNSNGDIEFREATEGQEENDGFIIRVKNNHDFPVYLSVLDIQPDNVINVTIPDPNDYNSSAEDYKIMPGKTLETRPVTLYPPYGKEFMKLLITAQPMDLKGIQTRNASRGAGNSFENFYNDTFKDDDTERSRGPRVAPVKVDEIRIIPFTFNIVATK